MRTTLKSLRAAGTTYAVYCVDGGKDRQHTRLTLRRSLSRTLDYCRQYLAQHGWARLYVTVDGEHEDSSECSRILGSNYGVGHDPVTMQTIADALANEKASDRKPGRRARRRAAALGAAQRSEMALVELDN